MRNNYSTVTDEDLQALVDGAYDVEVHERLMDEVKEHPLLRARIDELYKQKYMLQQWWRTVPTM